MPVAIEEDMEDVESIFFDDDAADDEGDDLGRDVQPQGGQGGGYKKLRPRHNYQRTRHQEGVLASA